MIKQGICREDSKQTTSVLHYVIDCMCLWCALVISAKMFDPSWKEKDTRKTLTSSLSTEDGFTNDLAFIWNCINWFIKRLRLHSWLQWFRAKHLSCTILVNDLFSHSHCFYNYSPVRFYSKRWCSWAVFLFFCSPNRTWCLTLHPIPPFLFDHQSIRLTFISVSSTTLVGAERYWVYVCLALLIAFLMSMKTLGVSPLWRWGDHSRPRGDRPH